MNLRRTALPVFMTLMSTLGVAYATTGPEGTDLFSELNQTLQVHVSNIETCGDDSETSNSCITTLKNPDFVSVHWSPDPTIAATMAQEYDFDSVTVALCWSPEGIADRKWRDKKDNVDENKQCKGFGGGLNKPTYVETGLPWNATASSYNIEILKNQPTSTYFVRILVKNSAGKYVAYGDTLNTKAPHCAPVKGRYSAADDLALTNSNTGCGFFKIEADEGVTDEMMGLSTVFCLLAMAILITMLVYEGIFRQKPELPTIYERDDSVRPSSCLVMCRPPSLPSHKEGKEGKPVTSEGKEGKDGAPMTAPGKAAPMKTPRELLTDRFAEANTHFPIDVDSEGKATELKIVSCGFPHMLSFHLSTVSFFISFISTFAAAPLMPVIRDNLNLTIKDIGNSGIAAVSACVGARFVMGSVCDILGPRYGHAVLQLLTAPAVACMPLVTTSTGFIVVRFFIGCGLATFVSCQFWTSILFSGVIVGTANATSGGWGNLGGGVVQFFMPAVMESIVDNGVEQYNAWRYAYYIPAALHIVIAVLTMAFGQDMPHGQYADLKYLGMMVKKRADAVAKIGFLNYRSWCLFILYGMSFGVELTMNNIAASFFFDRFGLTLSTASLIASCFGLMNIFARTLGGLISDLMSKYLGMRGRLWALFLIMMAEGLSCICMGKMNSLGGAIVVMIVFSGFVQAAEGASYGIVPFVSRRALGIVSGIVGAGGNLGSVVTQALFFKGQYETQDGILYMGFLICAVTVLCSSFIHFPQWGSMFFGPNLNVTEEDYYSADYTAEEIAAGMNQEVMAFARNSKKELGPALNEKRGYDKDGKPKAGDDQA